MRIRMENNALEVGGEKERYGIVTWVSESEKCGRIATNLILVLMNLNQLEKAGTEKAENEWSEGLESNEEQL